MKKTVYQDIKKLVNLLLILLAVGFLMFTAAYSIQQENTEKNYQVIGEDEDLVIVNLDVGKADSAILSYQGTFGLIDTGTKDAYDTIEKVLKANKIQSIDFMIITHYDKDHVGSAVKLLRKYDVKKLYLPDYVSEKSGYSDLLAEVAGDPNVVQVSKEQQLTVKGLTIRIIPPEEPEALFLDSDKIDNNMSLMCMVTLKNKRFLFTGDIEENRIEQILDRKEDVKADWLKVPYHGGYASNTKDFLAAVSPQYAVISTGYERPAEAKTLMALAELNIQRYSTTEGSVVTVSDGENITVSYLEN